MGEKLPEVLIFWWYAVATVFANVRKLRLLHLNLFSVGYPQWQSTIVQEWKNVNLIEGGFQTRIPNPILAQIK